MLLATACSGEAGRIPLPEERGLGRVPDVPAVACAPERGSAPLDEGATPTECRTDADCTEGRNGRCLRLSNHGPRGPSLEATVCSYDECFSDADCGPRQMCRCAERGPGEPGSGHSCAGGECQVDADCGEGRYCRRGPYGRYCHSLRDECVEETDCGAERGCMRAADGIRRCAPLGPPPVG